LVQDPIQEKWLPELNLVERVVARSRCRGVRYSHTGGPFEAVADEIVRGE